MTLNGEPVAGANVTFHPLDSRENALASQAVTDAAGRFQLTTHVGGGQFKNGVIPGDYSVAVIKLDTAAIKNTLAPPKNALSTEYSNSATSGLTAKVVAGQKNDFSFNLTVK